VSKYTAEVVWTRGDQPFLDKRYSRRHLWRFDGGTEVPASSSPDVVRVPLSDPAAVDPEEAFVASLASCHMLFFLAIAAKRGFRIDRYADASVGLLETGSDGKMSMTVVTMHPDVTFSGDRLPSQAEQAEMHHHSHEACYIANSVKTAVFCEPVYRGE
jgi:organic hydroperoxide reductase OsmC/OhrA